MKFLVLTDLHQKKSCIGWINKVIEDNNPDFTLFLGDVTNMGTGQDAKEIIEMIKSEVYVIPGNCDSRDMPSAISSSAHNMHGKSAKVDGEYIVGLGGSNITIFGTPFELEEDEIYRTLKPISKEGMILMTHAPTYGMFDHIPNGTSVGSTSIKKIVEEYRPIMALSGHVHEDRGVTTKNNTMYCNPGAAKDGYCAIVTLNDNKTNTRLIGPLD